MKNLILISLFFNICFGATQQYDNLYEALYGFFCESNASYNSFSINDNSLKNAAEKTIRSRTALKEKKEDKLHSREYLVQFLTNDPSMKFLKNMSTCAYDQASLAERKNQRTFVLAKLDNSIYTSLLKEILALDEIQDENISLFKNGLTHLKQILTNNYWVNIIDQFIKSINEEEERKQLEDEIKRIFIQTPYIRTTPLFQGLGIAITGITCATLQAVVTYQTSSSILVTKETTYTTTSDEFKNFISGISQYDAVSRPYNQNNQLVVDSYTKSSFSMDIISLWIIPTLTLSCVVLSNLQFLKNIFYFCVFSFSRFKFIIYESRFTSRILSRLDSETTFDAKKLHLDQFKQTLQTTYKNWHIWSLENRILNQMNQPIS
ncbi:MAG: hypothetical protein FADNKDHG_01351 [Holosporales bacterium]